MGACKSFVGEFWSCLEFFHLGERGGRGEASVFLLLPPSPPVKMPQR